MSIKDGAEVNGLRVEMLVAWVTAEKVYSQLNVDCVLTEGTGGKHGVGSLHYVGLAIDLRTRNFLNTRIEKEVADEIRERLGSQYDVVLEDDHIHIEYQPK